ncbi:MAG: isopentenyl-diphosphate Delta-isomerase [Bacteroidia bacterium]|nr:isopentenyl-diphosphate Delta-isomerase [Bacteroidia bacterium]
MKDESVILVDEHDKELGIMEKQEAHLKGLLHRAFSVLIFNNNEQLLLQQRSKNKYHSAGLWTNTCCSHPRPGEAVIEAAHRRLKEEMGFDCKLIFKQKFIYKTAFENGLTEHELDYVYTGIYNKVPLFNTNEVAAYKWMEIDDVMKDLVLHPTCYTAWFKIIMNKLSSYNN